MVHFRGKLDLPSSTSCRPVIDPARRLQRLGATTTVHRRATTDREPIDFTFTDHHRGMKEPLSLGVIAQLSDGSLWYRRVFPGVLRSNRAINQSDALFASSPSPLNNKNIDTLLSSARSEIDLHCHVPDGNWVIRSRARHLISGSRLGLL